MAELASKDELTMHMPQAEVPLILKNPPGGATLLHNCEAEGTKKDGQNETKRKCSPSQLRKPICGNCREIAISATVMAHRNDREMHRKCGPKGKGRQAVTSLKRDSCHLATLPGPGCLVAAEKGENDKLPKAELMRRLHRQWQIQWK